MHITLPHDHGTLPNHMDHQALRPETFAAVAEILTLMSDSNRIQIFWLLCHGEECVTNLSALLSLSSPTVSHHLKLLKTAGIIISRREGKEVYYTAAKTPRTAVLHDMVEQLMDIACPSQEIFEESQVYDSTVQTINEIHQLLTSDLTRWYTVQELSTQFHLNSTTLKSTFKTVFGQPIATYMKEYRIQRAKELLSRSNRQISDISYAVGYENPSKFSQAFKQVTGMLPREYRREHGNM